MWYILLLIYLIGYIYAYILSIKFLLNINEDNGIYGTKFSLIKIIISSLLFALLSWILVILFKI